MKPTILRNRVWAGLLAVLFSVGVTVNLEAFTYTNFNSTAGMNLTGVAAVVGGALRLTPAAPLVVGTAWAVSKQPCAAGFDTRFRFRISNSGAYAGTPPGGDGILFTVQNIGPADPSWHPNTSPADGSISVFFNTFWNWPDSTDFTLWDVSGDSVGVVSNGLYVAQTDLTPRGVNLEDGAVHEAHIAFDGTGLTVWLDGMMVLTNVPVPGMASAVDAAGNGWVGFDAGTGWAWENHDILSWSFNESPVARCADVIVSAGTNCLAEASVDNGSFDPDGDPITITQSPAGPYPLGTNLVTLTVSDDKGVSNSCSALVIVLDQTPPVLTCPSSRVLEFQDENGAIATYNPTATDNCSPLSVETTPPSGSVFPIGVTPVQVQATDSSSNTAECSFTVTVLGAQGVKSNVLAQLVAVRENLDPSQPFAQKLDEAIEHLADSLNPACWIDQVHLQAKSGNTAMNEEKLAAQTLGEILGQKGSPIDVAVLQEFIERIVKCDRLLAVISVQEAARAGLNPRKVEQDFETIAKGDHEAEAEHYANAIEQYRNAWRHGLQLQVQVGLSADGSTRLQFVGNESKSYRVEVSTNLVDWTVLGTCAGDSEGNVEFSDPNGANQPARFYRVVEQ